MSSGEIWAPWRLVNEEIARREMVSTGKETGLSTIQSTLQFYNGCVDRRGTTFSFADDVCCLGEERKGQLGMRRGGGEGVEECPSP